MKNPKIAPGRQAVKDKEQLINKAILSKKLANLRNKLTEYQKGRETQDEYIVFISVSDGIKRAVTVHAKGESFEEAWNAAEKSIFMLSERHLHKALWIKAELVNYVRKINKDDLASEFKKSGYPYFFRMGMSLDEDFNVAFTEGECNGVGIYDYSSVFGKNAGENNPVDVKRIIKLRLHNGENGKAQIGENIYLFSTKSFFADESGTYELYENGIHAGRRIISEVDQTTANTIIHTASEFLAHNICEDGTFVYGVRPITNHPLGTYNILRHAGTIWSLLRTYKVTKDNNLCRAAEEALKYLKSQIRFKDENTSYLIEGKEEEFKLGGNAISILALSEYYSLFPSKCDTNLIRALAEGILSFMNPDNYKFVHVLNSRDYSVKSEFRTIFYEGESAYALIRAYEVLKEKKYLDVAGHLIDRFIEENYIKYHDHWVSYALNAYTGHVKETKYYIFALKNVWENRAMIDNGQTTSHITFELLCEAKDTVCRMVEEGIKDPYLEEINLNILTGMIKHRAWHMLDGYIYPEFAMFFSAPSTVVGTFMVRHEEFRVRIDDIQHFLGGYIKYLELLGDGKLDFGKEALYEL